MKERSTIYLIERPCIALRDATSPSIPTTLSANGAATSQPRAKPRVRTATNPEGQRPDIKPPHHPNSVILSEGPERARRAEGTQSKDLPHHQPQHPARPFHLTTSLRSLLVLRTNTTLSSRPKRSAVERSPYWLLQLVWTTLYQFLNGRHFVSSDEKRVYQDLRPPRKYHSTP